MNSISNWIESQDGLSRRQIRYGTWIWAVAGLYILNILIAENYAEARSGQYFNLAIHDSLPLAPDLVHRSIVIAILPATLMLFTRFASAGSGIMALVLFYLTVSDYFGFRHLWVYLGNIYLMLSMILLGHGGRASRHSLSARYSTFVFRSYVSLFYFITATAKFDSGFVQGHVIAELAGRWAYVWPSLHAVLETIPLGFSAMAVSTIIVELGLAVCLVMPRLRQIAILIGSVFHIVVPIVGKVAPDLNIFVVATYLFFISDPEPEGERARTGESRYSLRHYRHPVIAAYLLLWFYYLLPLEPWPWVSMPLLFVLSLLLIVYDVFRSGGGRSPGGRESRTTHDGLGKAHEDPLDPCTKSPFR